MSTVDQILARKRSNRVACIDGGETVLEAARKMNERRIGALIVTEGERVVGIFTERDILNRVVANQRDPATVQVRNVMSAPVACCARETPVTECRSVMRARRVRHLPVVENGQLVGMISIGDILEDVNSEQSATIRYLYEYLYGEHVDLEPAMS